MPGILVSKPFAAEYGDLLRKAAAEAGIEARVIHLPDDARERLSQEELDLIEVAYLSRDLRFCDHFASFGETMSAAPSLKWLHFASTGINQHAWLAGLVARGVKLTSSAGTNGEPVAHSAICGMLMLARRFPHWLDAQRRHAWEPMRGEVQPRDLGGQTVAVIGLGFIGGPIARFCQAVGMHVIGVRRTPRKADDPVHEMRTLAELPLILPRCDWIVLACPLTPETRHLLNDSTLTALPRGAHAINVARGECIDERALINALQSGRLAGAYLDVFEKEPLAADSPLWDMPNVICTPHAASLADGNERRTAEMFVANLVRWARGETLINERRA